MRPRRLAVVDTNVVVAGLLTNDPSAPTVRILDAMLSAELRFAVSIELLTEYREVLLRPRIQSRHRLSTEEVDTVLRVLARNAVVTAPPPSSQTPPDAGDRHLWDLLESLPEGVLVTGDQALRATTQSLRVATPREWFELD